MNVQHLESLNDQVAELTGTRVRETFPDRVLASADEVVLVDITPETLIERLQAGKVYPRERAEAALNNFFKIENLQALRQVALRQVAEEVQHKRPAREAVGTRDEELRAGASQAVGERLLALVTPRPRTQRLVRRAWRSAQRLDAQLDLLWVKPPDREPSEEEQQQVAALRRLAAILGAHLIVEEGDEVAEVVGRVAAERGTTYILLGQPRPRTGLRRFTEPLPQRLMRTLPGRGHPHRGRPRQAGGGDIVTLCSRSGLVLLGLLAGAAITLVVRRARAKPRTGGAANPPPVHRQRDLAPRGRRGLPARARRGRDAGAGVSRAVPLARSLEAPLPLECETALPLLEAIEQRALRRGVEVDSRIESGRSRRDALQRLIEAESLRPHRGARVVRASRLASRLRT